MTYSEPARAITYRIPGSLITTTRRIRKIPVAGLRIVTAAIAKALGYRLLRIQHGALGEVDHGAVPDSTTVFDDEIPAVANLDPDLLKALRQAAMDAAKDGVKLYVNSGWRSPDCQDQLLREAISKYGSAKEA